MDKVRNARRPPTAVTTDSVNKKYSKCRPAPTGGVNNYQLKIIVTINMYPRKCPPKCAPEILPDCIYLLEESPALFLFSNMQAFREVISNSIIGNSP